MSAASPFQRIQHEEGVAMPWNTWPRVSLDAVRNVSGAQKAARVLTGGDIQSVMGGTALGGADHQQRLPLPIAALYTPAQNVRVDDRPAPNTLYVGDSPQICGRHDCRAILNPYCEIRSNTAQGASWICCFCKSFNNFQASYNQYLSNNQCPPEMNGRCTTAEYLLPSKSRPPIFLFVVDVSISEKELNCVKQSISVISTSIPKSSLVGIISFGTVVMLHQLYEVQGFYKSNVFSGSKKVDTKVIKDIVERQNNVSRIQNSNNTASDPLYSSNDFFSEYQACDLEFANIVDSLLSEHKSANIGGYVKRCTGVALDFAINLLLSMYANQPAKIITFIGGPISTGLGAFINEKEYIMRQFIDINNGKASMTAAALKEFEVLAQKAAKGHIVVDLYAGHADQVGLYELKHFPTLTNGNILLGDSFASNAFRQSLKKIYSDVSTPSFLYQGVIEVKTSRGLKVMGCIGPCFSMNSKSSNVSSMSVGVGGTSRWKINSLDDTTTLAFYFEGPTSAEDLEYISKNYSAGNMEHGYIQFITATFCANNTKKLRVTTVCRNWVDISTKELGLKALTNGFDQSAAMVCAARYAVYGFEFEDNPDCVRWLDKLLIAMVKIFAMYTPNQPTSVKLPQNFQFFPQFLFHFRRSNLVTTFNISPDESTYNKNMFIKSTIADTLTMIQPVLITRSLTQCHPVMLDHASIRDDNILVLDTFFIVLIYYGKQVSSWIKNGYHLRPEYAHIAQFIQKAQDTAIERVKNRKPTPRFVTTFHEGSQARFLYAKVNPSPPKPMHGSAPSNILTDDVCMDVFIQSLYKIVVSEEKNS